LVDVLVKSIKLQK